MERIKGWEKALSKSIATHMGLPSVYGISDCYLIADDAVLAMTGERMYSNIVYTSPAGAARQLIDHGFRTVEDAFRARFEEIPVSIAQRGDIGVTESNERICGGVFTSIGFATRDDSKVVFLPYSRVKTAFKVAR